MRVLVLGDDTPTGYSLNAFAGPLRRHELIGISMDATRWRCERQVNRLIRDVAPDVVLDARMVTLIDGAHPISNRHLNRSLWLAGACSRANCTYFYLSSAIVFSGAMTRPYRESDTPDAPDTLGELLISIEEQIRLADCESFILRLGRLFAGRRPNVLCTVLDTFRRGQPVNVSDSTRGSPVHVAEVARVTAGIMDQMEVGASKSGLYHYCSLGETGYRAFIEAVLACASQFEPFGNARELLIEDLDEYVDKNTTLDCEAIRHEFGIQQLSWRDFVNRAVTRYMELYVNKEKSK